MGYLPADRSFEANSWIQVAAVDLLVPSDCLWKGRWDRAGVKHSLGVSFVGLIGWVCHQGKQSTLLVERCTLSERMGAGRTVSTVNRQYYPGGPTPTVNFGLRCRQGPCNV